MECEARADDWNDDGDSPLHAFQMSKPPYRTLARHFAAWAGSCPIQLEYEVFGLQGNQGEMAERLVQAANTDPLAFDAAMWLVAECIRHDRKVPDQIKEWAYVAITGQITRPKLNGKYPPALFYRYEAIITLVRDVVRIVKLHATSFKEEEGQSACHAVSEGLRLLRLQPGSYVAIRRIWRSRSKVNDELPFLRPLP